MPSTKEKILDTALQLFNENGLAQVSQRTISEKMGISPGNLTYHFKKREDIIEGLYFQLVDTLNQELKVSTEGDFTIKMLNEVLQFTLRNLYNYRFFMIDFVQIMRGNEKIKLHFSELSKFRKQQFLMVVYNLIQSGRMRQPELHEEYENLYDRFQIFGDFWVASTVVRNQKLSEVDVSTYSNILLQSLYPYLTPKGKNEFLLLPH